MPTCFFCYAWGDPARYSKLEFLRNSLLQHALSPIEVILDKKDYNDNQDFNELREKITKYDLVVVFCTPDLKRIVQNPNEDINKDREVLKEYRIIEDRYKNNKNSIFVVILEGDKDSSLLPIFSSINARNFNDFNISYRKKKFTIAKNKRIEFHIFLSNLIGASIYNNWNKSVEYKSSRIAMDKLFTLTDNTTIPNSCLVTPNLYNQIRNQQCYLVVGRKGSGKSTFINNFCEMDRKYFEQSYKHTIPIFADTFQHEYFYSTIVSGHLSDSKLLDSYVLLCLFWKLLFILQGILTIRGEIESHQITEKDSRYRIFSKVTNILKTKIGLKRKNGSYKPIKSDGVGRSLFNAAVEMINNRYHEAFYECNENELLLTAFISRFNEQAIMESIFTEKNLETFIIALNKCKKRIMISLDGFDTHSDDFRIYTSRINNNDEEVRRRNEYEMLFYRTLVEVVTKIKNGDYHDQIISAFSRIFDFCIVLPKDRIDQIAYYDRDYFKRKFGVMSWSAYGLMGLIVKRLEYLIQKNNSNFPIESSDNFFVRLDKALSFFPGLPKTISMSLQNNHVEMTLFNYILRSSFWRPRDIISNLSCLISRLVTLDSKGEWIIDKSTTLSEEEVRRSIRDNAEHIISEEFYKEYKYVFRNLEYVLNKFKNQNELMESDAFMEILYKTKFDTSYNLDFSKTSNKLLILYQLGAIGLRFEKEEAERKEYSHNVCFEFNAGMRPINDFIHNNISPKSETLVAFNPILIRILELKKNSIEIIGNWSTDYIIQNDREVRFIK